MSASPLSTASPCKKRPSPECDALPSEALTQAPTWQSPGSSMSPSLPSTPLPVLPIHGVKPAIDTRDGLSIHSHSPSSNASPQSAIMPLGITAAGAPPPKRQKLTAAAKEEKRKEKEAAERRKVEQVSASYIGGGIRHQPADEYYHPSERSAKRRSDRETLRDSERRRRSRRSRKNAKRSGRRRRRNERNEGRSKKTSRGQKTRRRERRKPKRRRRIRLVTILWVS